jgi:hypothetical protein
MIAIPLSRLATASLGSNQSEEAATQSAGTGSTATASRGEQAPCVLDDYVARAGSGQRAACILLHWSKHVGGFWNDSMASSSG